MSSLSGIEVFNGRSKAFDKTSVVLAWSVVFCGHALQAQICNPAGNVIVISNYEGGTVNLNMDVNQGPYKLGICTYEPVEVNVVGPFAANVTEIIYAGYNSNNGTCTGVLETAVNAAPSTQVTIYSGSDSLPAYSPYLGDDGFLPGFPIASCMVGAESCDNTASGGGNSSPQIVQFFLAEFGAGSSLYWHQTDYNCFNNLTLDVGDGGNCCLQTPQTPPNPYYQPGGGTFQSLIPDTGSVCQGPLIFDFSDYPTLWQNYTWSDGFVGEVHQLDTPGTYTLVMSDYCYTFQDTIVVPPCCLGIPPPVTDGDSTYCLGEVMQNMTAIPQTTGTVSWFADAALNVLLDTGQVLAPLPTTGTTVYYAVVDSATCTSTPDSVTVTIIDVQAVLTGDTTPCEGSLADLQCNGGITYLWSNGSTGPMASLDTGLVWVVATGAAGCTDSVGTLVSWTPYPLVDIGADTTLCPEETLALDATQANATYLWDDGTISPTILVDQADLHWVTVTVAGCTTRDSIIVGYHPLAIPNLGPDRLLCTPDSLTLSVVGNNASVVWRNVQTGELLGTNPSISIDQGALVHVNVSNAFCSFSDTMQVNALPLVHELDLGVDNPIVCPDQPALLDATLPRNPQYRWNTGDTTATLSVGYLGTYSVRVTGLCVEAADTVWARAGACGPFIYLPTAFSPNGDGTNDTWDFVMNSFGEDFRLEVFDRWGKMAFATQDPTLKWDGTTNGTPAPIGIYQWRLEYTTRLVNGDATAESMTGTVTVLR
jgi:gliding motility-associated-like protein